MHTILAQDSTLLHFCMNCLKLGWLFSRSASQEMNQNIYSNIITTWIFIVVSFFKPFICPFLTTCAFQLYRLMPTSLLSELAHLSTGQLQSSWDPFGDHGMKLVAFKVKLIHAPALVKTFCTHLNHFQFQMFLLGSFSKAFLCKTLNKLDKGRRNDVADVDPPEVLHCFLPPQWCHNGLDSGCEYCCLTLF